MKIYALIIMVIFTSCSRYSEQDLANAVHDPYSVILIDKCEYIQYGGGNSYAITHKGNCNNPIHGDHYVIPQMIYQPTDTILDEREVSRPLTLTP